MRALSNTENGGKVVEFTHDEWRQLKVLAMSLEGKTLDDAKTDFFINGSNRETSIVEYDFNGVFGAIKAFYEANFELASLKQLIGKYDEFMKIKK